MKTIDFDIWESNPDRPGTVRRVGQRTAQEVFAELQQRLESTGYLPDEYFLLDHEWANGKEIPKDAGFFCTVDYGGSEGVYLDVYLKWYDEQNQKQITKNFITGKTLGETGSDLDRMYLTASAITKAFNGDNAVFVGYDENGVPRHAHKRGLYTEGTGFKGNVDGCDPKYSFHYAGTDNSLYVLEAPIDLLSYITLYPQDWQKHSYVALCGVSGYAMLKMLELHPHLDHVVLCLDNDEAGHKASDRLKNQLIEKAYFPQRLVPQAKDWNDDLTMAQQTQDEFEMRMT